MDFCSGNGCKEQTKQRLVLSVLLLASTTSIVEPRALEILFNSTTAIATLISRKTTSTVGIIIYYTNTSIREEEADRQTDRLQRSHGLDIKAEQLSRQAECLLRHCHFDLKINE